MKTDVQYWNRINLFTKVIEILGTNSSSSSQALEQEELTKLFQQQPLGQQNSSPSAVVDKNDL
jgi:hypothetical protein